MQDFKTSYIQTSSSLGVVFLILLDLSRSWDQVDSLAVIVLLSFDAAASPLSLSSVMAAFWTPWQASLPLLLFFVVSIFLNGRFSASLTFTQHSFWVFEWNLHRFHSHVSWLLSAMCVHTVYVPIIEGHLESWHVG